MYGVISRDKTIYCIYALTGGIVSYKVITKTAIKGIIASTACQGITTSTACQGISISTAHQGIITITAIQGIIITEGPFFKKPCIIPRIKFVIDDPTLFGFTFTRIQFPINVAFAMTIHKSEGQTLQQVGLYLPDPVFTHGMLYTALSRCTTRKGVTVLLGVNQRPPDKHEGWYTANIVFRNVLIDE
jgi:hypothetical protein